MESISQENDEKQRRKSNTRKRFDHLHARHCRRSIFQLFRYVFRYATERTISTIEPICRQNSCANYLIDHRMLFIDVSSMSELMFYQRLVSNLRDFLFEWNSTVDRNFLDYHHHQHRWPIENVDYDHRSMAAINLDSLV
jgi:hypothetical protein